MSYGLSIKSPSGLEILSTTTLGGRVYVGKIVLPGNQTAGTTTVYTYPGVPSPSNIYIYIVSNGIHDFTTGTDGSGNTTVTATARSKSSLALWHYGTVAFVFSSATADSNLTGQYGLSFTNDSGQTTVSTNYPVPEFLGKVSFNALPEVQTLGGYVWYTGNTNNSGGTTTYAGNYSNAIPDVPLYQWKSQLSNLGAGRDRIILWNLPADGSVWYAPQEGYIDSSETGDWSLTMIVGSKNSLGSIKPPEALIFALNGHTPNNDQYGLRVYDSSGNVTFDASKEHLVISQLGQEFFYPVANNSVSQINQYSMTGANPCFIIPAFSQYKLVRRSNNLSSNEWDIAGFMNKIGSSGNYTAQAAIMLIYNGVEDYPANHTDTYGYSRGITLAVDGNLYGASVL